MIAVLALIVCLGLACSEAAADGLPAAAQAVVPEAAVGSPFAAGNLDAWRTAGGAAVTNVPETGGWEVVDGVWHLVPQPAPPAKGRRVNHTIVTADEFGDFTLSFEWRIAAGGNGGIKYRVRSYGTRLLGCEYQILDDLGYRRPLSPQQSAGALYGLFAPIVDKPLRPATEWNTGRIVVRDERLEHWLNGRRVVVATVGDTEWDQRIAESKFNEFAGFGRNRLGRLMLTDHGAETWLRAIVFEPAAE